jgi:succinate dehydrogenase/fumarate reductase cytochrome b subunit
MGIEFNGLLGLIILGLDIWAILNIAQSRVPNGNKVLWILLVLILPLLGFIIWFFAGPRSR